MTFSMEDLPAPFGPMMARTSCSRTSNDTFCSAFTPPKESETSSTARITSPTVRPVECRWTSGAVILRGLLRRRGCERLRVADFQVGREGPGAPVLVAHLRLYVNRIAPRIERLHERSVLLADEPAPHLPRAGELAVVGVEFLVQDEEPVDLRVGELRVLRQIGVNALHALAHELVDLRLGGEVGVAGVGQVAPLGPVPHRLGVDVDEGADTVAAVPEADRLAHERKELQLVLEVLRCEERAVGEAADILHAVDDLHVAVLVEVAGVARVVPALGVQRLEGGLRVLVVLLEKPGAADEELALRRELELDPRHRGPDRVGPHLAVRLHADED